MGKGDAPAPPDYAGAAQQQGTANLQNTLAQAQLNRPSSVSTPFGTQSWQSSPSGNVINGMDIPNYSGSFQLAPQFQPAVDRVGETVGQPFEFGSTDDLENAYLERLNPQLDRRREQLAQSLSNQGIKLGSDSYRTAQDINTQGENDAVHQALTQGMGARGQMLQQALSLRNQPLNELTALASGQQIGVPQFSPVAAPQAGNYQGAAQAAGGYQTDVYNADQAAAGNNTMAAASVAAAYFL